MRTSRLTLLFLTAAAFSPLAASARIGETPEESQKRYGTPAFAAEGQSILPNATNHVFSYMGWEITSAYVDSKTVRIRYRKGRMVEESGPSKAREAGPANKRQLKKRAELAKLDPNNPSSRVTVTRFKEDALTPDEIKNILKSESPVGNWREYDPKTQSHNAVFAFTEKAFPPKLINDFGLVAHVKPTSVVLEKLTAVQEFEKPSAAPKGTAPVMPKF